MAETFVITGLVREKESGVGLGGLIVRAYDKDIPHAIACDLPCEEAGHSHPGHSHPAPGDDCRAHKDHRHDEDCGWSSGVTASLFIPRLFTVELSPPLAVARGAGWRVVDAEDKRFINDNQRRYPLIPGPFNLQFKLLPR